MNSRHIQTFLMVSAAFFAISAPARSSSAQTLANAVTRAALVAPASSTATRSGSSTRSDRRQ
jgi:hypothetical protein